MNIFNSSCKQSLENMKHFNEYVSNYNWSDLPFMYVTFLNTSIVNI